MGAAVYNRGIMTPLREWLKPPKSLLLILFLLTLVSVSALGWFGFKLLEQDRMVQAQQRQERLEQAADRISATTQHPCRDRRAAERVARRAALRRTAGWRHSADRRRQRDGGVSRVACSSTLRGERSRGAGGTVFRGRIARIPAGAAGPCGRGVSPKGGIRRPGDTGRRPAAAGPGARQTGAARGKLGGLHADGGDHRRAGGGCARGPGGAARTRRPGSPRRPSARALAADARATGVLLRRPAAGGRMAIAEAASQA